MQLWQLDSSSLGTLHIGNKSIDQGSQVYSGRLVNEQDQLHLDMYGHLHMVLAKIQRLCLDSGN